MRFEDYPGRRDVIRPTTKPTRMRVFYPCPPGIAGKTGIISEPFTGPDTHTTHFALRPDGSPTSIRGSVDVWSQHTRLLPLADR